MVRSSNARALENAEYPCTAIASRSILTLSMGQIELSWVITLKLTAFTVSKQKLTLYKTELFEIELFYV